MAAKVQWYRDAWWVMTHHRGKRKRKRVGRTKADKRQAEEIAKKINAAIALGTFSPAAQAAEKAIPFDRFAGDWLRTEVQLPIDRRIEGALAPATARIHEGHIRRHLVPFFGETDLREIRVAEIQRFYDRCLETGKPRSARSIEMILGTLGRMLAYAEAHELIDSNAVDRWKRNRGRRRRSSAYRVDPENVLNSSELERFLCIAESKAPDHYAFVLFLTDTGARLGEASALRWIDVDGKAGTVRIARSFSDGKDLALTKTGKQRTVELSSRLGEELARIRPDLFGDETLVFPGETGGPIDPHNFRSRVFRPIVQEAFGKGRRFTPHGLRHTFASLHLARGTNLKWIQAQGGWASAKVLLDWYGHYLPTETSGYADALSSDPGRPYTAPAETAIFGRSRRLPKRRTSTTGCVAPRGGIEPPTRRLEGDCSIRLSYRGRCQPSRTSPQDAGVPR